MTDQRLRGLYAITDSGLCAKRGLQESVAQALAGGARLVQYRDKTGDAQRRLAEARALRALCRAAGALLIINDDVDLALASSADGVHLGGGDTPLAAARERLGAAAVIGISCYDRLDLALEAERAGASYVAFGAFFPSPTKPGAAAAPVALLPAARARLDLPIAAIGGITPANGDRLVAAGADMLAVISAVFDAADVRAAAAACAALYT